ncbi:MAG: FG-GAP repeat domain-containing protein, partial [Verrucomicrobiales bacterium]
MLRHPFVRLLGSGLLCLFVCSCGKEGPTSKQIGSEQAPTKPIKQISPGSVEVLSRFAETQDPEGTLFEELDSKSTGIEFVNPIDNDHPLNRLYISGFASSGVAVGDVDSDGLVDLYLTRGPGANALYRQTAPFQFEDISERAGVALKDLWSSGAAFADVNGDGHLDLYVCAYDAPNKLLINDGRGRFT